MSRNRRITLALVTAATTTFVAALYVTVGAVDAMGVIAVTAVLVWLYMLRRYARRALVYDGGSHRRKGAATRERTRAPSRMLPISGKL